MQVIRNPHSAAAGPGATVFERAARYCRVSTDEPVMCCLTAGMVHLADSIRMTCELMRP